MLEQAGITVDKFGGEAFRAAVSEGNTKLADCFWKKGQTSITTSRTWCFRTPPPLSLKLSDTKSPHGALAH